MSMKQMAPTLQGLMLCVCLFAMNAMMAGAQPSNLETGWEFRGSFEIGQHATDIDFGSDFDGDGLLEVVVLGRWEASNGPNIYIYEQTGADNGLTEVWTGTRPGNLRFWQGPLALGDSDDDGNQDMVVGVTDEFPGVNLGGAVVIEFDPGVGTEFNDDNPTITQQITIGELPSSFEIGDLDGDGNSEMLLGSYDNNGGLIIQETTGDDTYSSLTVALQTGGTTPTAVQYLSPVVDLDGDGENEIAVLCSDTSVKILSWDGTGQPTVEAEPFLGTPGSSILNGKIALGDVDGNGTLEILAADEYRPDGSALRIIRVTGADSYALDNAAGFFDNGDRMDSIEIIRPSEFGPARIIVAYDVGSNDLQLWTADYVGAGDDFSSGTLTTPRPFADIEDEPEALLAVDQLGTVDGDNRADLFIGLRGGGGWQEIQWIENTEEFVPVELSGFDVK